MVFPFIDLSTQYNILEEKINDRINKVLTHGQYIMGPEVEELEEALSKFSQAKHVITVSSGTDALLIALMSIGIKAGDEVITSPFSFAATAEVIIRLGAKPVFVDVESNTGLLDAHKIAPAITDRTKAIIPVSLYGQSCDMDLINNIADLHELVVIEDGAQSFGSTQNGKKSCNLSKIGCTSFFPSKPLGCYGDGGAIFTNDDKIARDCKEIRVHGQSKRYWHSQLGVGGRMDTLQCAILLAKLSVFDEEIIRRHEIGDFYNKSMENMGILRIHQKKENLSVYAQYTIMSNHRDKLVKVLSEKNIPTAIHYPVPLNQQPAFRYTCCPECTPNAANLSSQVLSLPMGPYLKQSDQNEVISALHNALVKN